MRARPSLATQSAASWRGRLSSVTGSACSIAPDLIEQDLERRHRTADAADARTSGGAPRNLSRASASRRAETAPLSLASPAACRNAVGCCGYRLLHFRVRRRRARRCGERRLEALGGVADECQLLRLLRRHEARERDRPGNLGQGGEPGATGCAASSEGASTLIVLGVQSGSAVSAFNVAIDSTVGFLRLSGSKSKRSCGSSASEATAATEATAEDGTPAAMDEGVDRRQHRKADLRHALAGRTQHHQQRRQQHDGQHEGHDHADAGDRAELRHADVGRSAERRRSRR